MTLGAGPSTLVEPRRRRSSWWRILLGGAILYGIGITLLLFSHKPNPFPTVVLIGSFLVPVAYVSLLLRAAPPQPPDHAGRREGIPLRRQPGEALP